MTRTPDVLVVGAGIVGAATALGLAKAGLTVQVLEAEFAGAGSTGAAMGHLCVMDDSEAQIALCRHSRRRWKELKPILSSRVELERPGTLWLAATDQEFRAAAKKAERLHANGVRAELLDAKQLAEAEPALRADLVGALRVPDDMVCYPPVAARELLDLALAEGATLTSGRRAIAVESGGARLVDGDVLNAGLVVVAAGAFSPRLVPGLAVVPRKGHLLITEPSEIRFQHQVIELGYLDSAHSMGAASVAFNIQPRQSGQLLVGSSRELVGFDRSLNRPLLGRMLKRAVEYVPSLAQVPASRAWTGFRPATPDALPLIGPMNDLKDVWVATGHEGLGVTMATGTADLVVAGITGAEPPVDPQPFLPDRSMPETEEAVA